MKKMLGQWMVGCVALALGGLGQVLEAQEIEVKQIRDRQAIVEFPPGLTPQQGQILIPKSEMAHGEGAVTLRGEEEVPASSLSGSRRFLMSANFNFGSNRLKEEGELFKSSYGMIGARFGLNLGIIEFGGLTELDFSKLGGQSVERTKIRSGLFGELNLIRNWEPNNLIPGLGLELALVRETYPFFGGSGFSQRTLSGFSAFPHGYLKWFWPGTSVATKLNFGYRLEQVSGGGRKQEEARIELGGAFSIYF